MSSPKTVVIKISSSKKNLPLIFQKNIAGVTAFKRLIFSLQQAGIQNFIIFQQNPAPSQQHSVETSIKSDSRFKSNLQWHGFQNDSFSENLNPIKLLSEFEKVLLVESDLVTTSGLIKDLSIHLTLLNLLRLLALLTRLRTQMEFIYYSLLT